MELQMVTKIWCNKGSDQLAWSAWRLSPLPLPTSSSLYLHDLVRLLYHWYSIRGNRSIIIARWTTDQINNQAIHPAPGAWFIPNKIHIISLVCHRHSVTWHCRIIPENTLLSIHSTDTRNITFGMPCYYGFVTMQIQCTATAKQSSQCKYTPQKLQSVWSLLSEKRTCGWLGTK